MKKEGVNMYCPFCNNKIKPNLKVLYKQKCPTCSGKFSRVKKYSVFNFINIAICLSIYFLIEYYGNIFNMSDGEFKVLSFIVAFVILNILEFVLMLNLNKLDKKV